jgi:ankyrin repeat protein
MTVKSKLRLADIVTSQSCADFKALLGSGARNLQHYVQLGRNVNEVEVKAPHRSLLHLACYLGDCKCCRAEELVRLLVRKGANVNVQDDQGRSPLMVAPSVAIAQLLLQHKADLALLDKEGYSAVHLQCSSGRCGVIKLLMKRASKELLLSKTHTGWSCIACAMDHKKEEAALLVLDSLPADFDCDGNVNDITLLSRAAMKGLGKLATALLKRGADVNKFSASGYNAHMYACQAGALPLVDLLHKAGADIHTADSRGVTALMCAAAAGHTLVIKLLARLGVDIHVNSGGFGTAVARAVLKGHVEAAKALLSLGATLPASSSSSSSSSTSIVSRNSSSSSSSSSGSSSGSSSSGSGSGRSNSNSNSSSIVVSSSNNSSSSDSSFTTTIDPQFLADVLLLDDVAATKMLQVLLPYCSSGDLNALTVLAGDSRDRTLLMRAIGRKHLRAAKELVRGGADVSIKTKEWLSAVHIAAAADSVPMLQWTLSHGLSHAVYDAYGRSPLYCACQSGVASTALYLLSLPDGAGTLSAQVTGYAMTPLLMAVSQGQYDIARALLQKGASASERSKAHQTALMLAKDLRTVQLLLEHGAAAVIAVTDSRGMTALHHQAKAGVSAAVLCVLLKAGADPTAVDSTGSTPAHLAGVAGHFTTETLLSRAAEDYRKKHPAPLLLCNGSNSSSASGTDTTGSCSSGTECCSSTACGSSSSDSSNTKKSKRSATSISTACTDLTVHMGTLALYDSSVRFSAGVDADGESCSNRLRCTKRMKQPCALCSKMTTRLCRRCKTVFYCSTDCQRVCFQDPHHRLQCKLMEAVFTEAAETTKPPAVAAAVVESAAAEVETRTVAVYA